MGAGDKRKEGQPSSSSGKKHKASSSRGFQGQGRDYQGQGQIKAPSQLGPMTCYHCHQPGHIKKNFSQRQGSQSYETPQSQSSVRHISTQFVPSYPSMGQRNQYQPQGATDECKTHLCFEFISHVILRILYPSSCKTHNISSKLGFVGLLMKSK